MEYSIVIRKESYSDKKNNYTLENDIELFKKEYKYKFNDFLKSKKKSMLFTKLYACSCKMTAALFYSLKSAANSK